jgi:ABC-type nitrate/sulfonate/bicarbonate transport system substrate-binding protein
MAFTIAVNPPTTVSLPRQWRRHVHRIPVSAMLLFAAASLCACATGANRESAEHASGVPLAQRTEVGAPATVRVAYFTRGPVAEMAQKHGFFADEKLTVFEVKTTGSTLLFQNLRDGVWDIGLNVADNDFQFRYNPSNPLGMTFDPVIFARMDNGTGASLMSRPEIKTCADARGNSFAVDAPGSGYAFIGYQILRNKCGFEPKVDYPVVITGGTDRRYDDLVAGKPDSQMVLIHTGLPERAETKGMHPFGAMFPDAVSAYTGVVATATRRWLDAHGDVAVRFLRAMKRGTDYVLDPAHKAEILAILPADGDANTAERIYQMYITEAKGGLVPNLELDRRGLFATAQLRQTWGGWDAPQNFEWLSSPASGAFDLSYWRGAVK